MHLYTQMNHQQYVEALMLLKYTHKPGKKEKLRIINEASHKWKDIASLILFAVVLM
jgi:hypothetical protein